MSVKCMIEINKQQKQDTGSQKGDTINFENYFIVHTRKYKKKEHRLLMLF